MDDLAKPYREQVASNARWTSITQQEHPVLRDPWYCLHPCETAAIMRLLLPDEADSVSGAADSCTSVAAPAAAGACKGAQAAAACRAACDSRITHRDCTEAANRSCKCRDEQHAPVCCKAGWQHLRYFCAWYSSVASVVRLPMPLTLWPLSSADEDEARRLQLEPPHSYSVNADHVLLTLCT